VPELRRGGSLGSLTRREPRTVTWNA
jgi:hypothetical protein